MPRVRFAIALLVPEPAATEIDGLRRALGDRGIADVVPHITLVPPVNVPEERVREVLATIRQAAADAAPMTLRLGPPTTFAPVSPVVYLAVHGEVAAVHGLRDALYTGPLARPLVHEFVPHVTINEECAPDRIEAALHALGDYAVDVRVDRLHLLRDRADGPRRWNPVADAFFEQPLVVGRGGLPVEITVSALADPEVAPHFVRDVNPPADGQPLVVVARRGDEIIAAGRGWTLDGRPSFLEIVGDGDVERQLLKAATQSAAGRA